MPSYISMLSPDVCHQKLLDIVHRDEVKVNWILSYNVEFLNSEKGPRDRYKLRLFTPFKKDAKRWRENRENLVSNLESRWSVLVEGRALGCRSFAISLQVVLKQHREHTILLSRERVNRVNKGTNNFPVVISFILHDFTGKTADYKSCVTL